MGAQEKIIENQNKNLAKLSEEQISELKKLTEKDSDGNIKEKEGRKLAEQRTKSKAASEAPKNRQSGYVNRISYTPSHERFARSQRAKDAAKKTKTDNDKLLEAIKASAGSNNGGGGDDKKEDK
jgi:hypothetical protein